MLLGCKACGSIILLFKRKKTTIMRFKGLSRQRLQRVLSQSRIIIIIFKIVTEENYGQTESNSNNTL